MAHLAYDSRDDQLFEQRGMKNLYWLDDLGAVPLSELDKEVDSFLFAGARSIADYRELISDYPNLRDRPDHRSALLQLDTVLSQFDMSGIDVPRPKTWTWEFDHSLPRDIRYPLFVRTAKSSWKLGGKISKVLNEKQLISEAFELRRAFGYDQPIMAREWLDIFAVGEMSFGPVPLEIRTWIVDSVPFAWSFHHQQLVPNPLHFPLSPVDIQQLHELAGRISCFDSRLVCADFVKTINGSWIFLEAGPGSCAGTSHEFVYKSVASRIANREFSDPNCSPNQFGDLF